MDQGIEAHARLRKKIAGVAAVVPHDTDIGIVVDPGALQRFVSNFQQRCVPIGHTVRRGCSGVACSIMLNGEEERVRRAWLVNIEGATD